MSLTNTLVSRFKAQLASKVVTAAVGAALTIGLARLLDPNGYGIFSLTLTVVSMFQLIARFGIARSAGRYVAEYKENDPEQVPFIVRTALLVNLGTILIAALVLVGSHRYIASLLGEPELEPLLLVGVLFVALGTSISFLTKVIQGFEAIIFVAALNAVGRVSRLVLGLGFVVVGFGALGALWGYVISALFTSIVGFAYLFRRVRRLRNPESTVEPGLRRRIVEYAIPITATNTSIALDQRVDTLLVGFFLSPVAVSYYVIGEQVVRFLETPMTALGFTVSPTFGSQKAAGNLGRISRLYETTLTNALLMYVPAGAGIALVADPMITLLFGADYAGAVPVLQVLGAYVVLKAVTKISDNGLDFLGRARERAIARGITGTLNVGLNVLLIPAIGVVGAAIATVLTYGIYTAANLYIAANEFDLRVTFLLRRLALIAAITVTMSAVVFVLTEYISGWITFGLVVLVGVVIWAVLSMATGLLEARKLVSMLT